MICHLLSPKENLKTVSPLIRTHENHFNEIKWEIPMERRTVFVYDEPVAGRSSGSSSNSNNYRNQITAQMKNIKYDTIGSRLATREELKLVHSDKYISNLLDRSPLAQQDER